MENVQLFLLPLASPAHMCALKHAVLENLPFVMSQMALAVLRYPSLVGDNVLQTC